MLFPKKKRIENRELLDFYHTLPCVACGRYIEQGVVAHHIKTKKSGGDDVVENLMPLCAVHHDEIHKKGNALMLAKYPHLDTYLKKHVK